MNEINPILIWLNTFSATFQISQWQWVTHQTYLVQSTIILNSSFIVRLEKQVLIKLNTYYFCTKTWTGGFIGIINKSYSIHSGQNHRQQRSLLQSECVLTKNSFTLKATLFNLNWTFKIITVCKLGCRPTKN